MEVVEYDSKLELLYSRIAKATVAVLKPFLAFASQFNKEKVHNMLAIMLDPQYKGLQSISKFVGSATVAKVLVSQYNKEILLPLLVKVFHHRNSATSAKSTAAGDHFDDEVDEFCVFGGVFFTLEEVVKGLLLKELSLFCTLVIDADEL